MNIFALINNGKQQPATQVKPVKIAVNPNVQDKVNPTRGGFDLNDYYKKGFKTDEQNEDLAKEIRKEILINYNVSDDDSDKKEKLARIYLDIVENDTNQILSENVKSKGIVYNGVNDEEYIEAVEMALAQMTHDGTGKGDKVALSEVDFSDIEYTDEFEIGLMETKTISNGFEYVIYDLDNNIVKIISQTTDENGLTTISTYSDADKTDLISSETAFMSAKNDYETKFKFGTGNQNTVDFKDEGDTLSVNVSKGVIREDYTVEKSSDGTYTFNGKQYFALEEIANDLNQKELQTTEALDGNFSGTYQGKTGDCGLLSAINSFVANEYGLKVLNEAITFDDDGNATVNFAGIGREYTVSKKELRNASKYSTGDIENRVFEMAWSKMLKEVKDETLVRSNGHTFNNSKYDVDTKMKYGCDPLTGTYSASVYEVLTGKKGYTGIGYDIHNLLDRFEHEGSMLMTIGKTTNEALNGKAPSQNVSNPTVYQDAFGNDVTLYEMHSYAIKEVDTTSNGRKIITIINPHNSSEEKVLDEETFLKAFNQVDFMLFSANNLLLPAYKVA